MKSLRLNRHLKVREVAEGSGISRPYVSQIESGFSTLKIDAARKLAGFFGVDVEWLLTGQASPVEAAQERFQDAVKASGLDDDAERAIDEITLWLRHLITGPESMRKPALANIQAIADRFADQCAKRNAPIRQASLEMARARFSDNICKQSVDISSGSDISTSEMQALWSKHLAQIREGLPRGGQSALAKDLGITRQAISQYLSGASAPSIEIGLRMIDWVKSRRGICNEGPADAQTSTGPVTLKPTPSSEKTPRPQKK